jgi:hypothetical protein
MDMREGGFRKIAVGIENRNTFVGNHVLADEVEKHGALAGSGLADHVEMPAALLRIEHDRHARRCVGADAKLMIVHIHGRKGAGVPCTPQVGKWCEQHPVSRQGALGLHGVRRLCVMTGLPSPPLTAGSFPTTICFQDRGLHRLYGSRPRFMNGGGVESGERRLGPFRVTARFAQSSLSPVLLFGRGRSSAAEREGEAAAILAGQWRTALGDPVHAMENSDDDELVLVVVKFVNDDVRQSGHCPLVSTRHGTEASKLGKFAEAVGLGEDARHDVGGGTGAALPDIELNARDVQERFKREAHRHMVIPVIPL